MNRLIILQMNISIILGASTKHFKLLKMPFIVFELNSTKID
jgi:hypothetical protein